MEIKTLISLIFLSNCIYAQNYLTSEVIEKAEFYLQKAVGKELFNYFEIGPQSYYEYKTKSGKSKWKEINNGKRTKGKFINGANINFILKHPDFAYPYIKNTVYVQLDSSLNLIRDVYIDHIPEFLLKNKASDWLPENKIDEIIFSENLKESFEPIVKRLEFNAKLKKYYWIVFNTINKEKCFTDEEILYIDPILGIILKHFEERQFTMHCH